MKNISLLLITLFLASCGSKEEQKTTIDFITHFEKSNFTETATYTEVIDFYEALANTYTSIAMYEMDITDSGYPLHLITFNPNRNFESEFQGKRDKSILLINNGIHPGESDGIDASMMLLRDLANGKISAPENVIIAVIPVYNIGGALNRNSTSRTNQNGPKEYGFRGNARNFDLNRDFMKLDTRNALAFVDLFRTVKPDVFIDNHVSNGADYQYTLTHLFTQHNKMGGALGSFLNEEFMPAIEQDLALKSWDITPYVNVFNSTPEKGFSQFMDHPRYSTGYTTLFNTLGLMVETHMLKPYKDRVEGTYELMKSVISYTNKNSDTILKLRKDATKRYSSGSFYKLDWQIDSTKTKTLQFKGFEASTPKSEITGNARLKYNTNAPFTKDVTYYNTYKAIDSVKIPKQYIIPRGWWPIVRHLRANRIKCNTAKKADTIEVEVYHIDNYETVQRPYEGHYPHYNTKVKTTIETYIVAPGDYIVDTNQEGIQYILEALEPMAVDSFFNWNYFDTILQQKEGFSPYVWEDKALTILEENPELKIEFETKKQSDPAFESNSYAQLNWIHKNSIHYEKAHLRYPIVRVHR